MGISDLINRMTQPETGEPAVGRSQVTMRLPVATVWWLDVLAKRAGMSRTGFAQELVTQGVNQLVDEAEAAGVLTPEDDQAFEDFMHSMGG